MSELNGKHISIVGASEGIGLETAKECARRGARLSLVARSEQIKDIVRELTESQKHAGFCFDMSDIEKINQFIGELVDMRGLLCGATMRKTFENAETGDCKADNGNRIWSLY